MVEKIADSMPDETWITLVLTFEVCALAVGVGAVRAAGPSRITPGR